MIQRIQTVYLFLAAVFSGILTSVFNFWISNGMAISIFDFFSSKNILEKLIPLLFLSSAILSVFSIFKYSDRKLQFVLGRINILINFLLLGLLMYSLTVLSGEAIASEKGIGVFVPLIVVVLLVLANKAIKKDEDLVKSVDRLR